MDDIDRWFLELTRTCVKPHEPVNRFNNFIKFFKASLEEHTRISNQKLIRSAKSACGLNPDEPPTGFPLIFPFDDSPDSALLFVSKLSEKTFTKAGRKLDIEFLSKMLAKTLGFKCWESFMFSLEVYKNISKGEWVYGRHKIKKPYHFGHQDGVFLMPGSKPKPYGGLVPGTTYEVFSCEETSYHIAWEYGEPPFWCDSAKKYWGNSFDDARNWCIAYHLADYGIKSWNLMMSAQNPSLSDESTLKKLAKAADLEDTWLNNVRKELISYRT